MRMQRTRWKDARRLGGHGGGEPAQLVDQGARQTDEAALPLAAKLRPVVSDIHEEPGVLPRRAEPGPLRVEQDDAPLRAVRRQPPRRQARQPSPNDHAVRAFLGDERARGRQRREECRSFRATARIKHGSPRARPGGASRRARSH